MPKTVVFVVIFALMLAAFVSITADRTPLFLLIQHASIVIAIFVPLGWVAFDVLQRIWVAWRRMFSRPFGQR